MADVLIPDSLPCVFDDAWRGKCSKPSTNGWCSIHEPLRCCVCGDKAVRCCEHAHTLVCGASLCATCKHSLTNEDHVTGEIYQKQIEDQLQEKKELERSRTSEDQRLDKDGNPVNLFELLKKNPKEQGYSLENVYFLRIVHGLMGFYPAVMHSKRRTILCLDLNLLIRIWRTLEPQVSEIDSGIYYVNLEKGVAFLYTQGSYREEESLQQKILNRGEYDEIMMVNPTDIMWAPGLISFRNFTPQDFQRMIDQAIIKL